MFDLILSITVLAAFALMGGAWYLWKKRGQDRQAMLMAILSLVMLANVLVWTIPGGPLEETAGSGADAANDTAPGG
ncbi:hypothetical protein [Alteraurantiacibacter aquimixticola]|uniref:Uncharacterized protein n=1 Tax=Alteraurantiacibacter aquimixticola TaxID=2489173 RepID=A0A4T3F3Q4_9SPHN|nr:hypothetical protein [Alteraurantiacibacter aquimixticola]TIX51798.1 hypothetical protein E5222_04970 [Alteraurantiacibacter aquimixticola]